MCFGIGARQIAVGSIGQLLKEETARLLHTIEIWRSKQFHFATLSTRSLSVGGSRT